MEVAWNNIRKAVELPGLCQIIHTFSWISSVESVHMACQSKSVSLRFCFGVYVKRH